MVQKVIRWMARRPLPEIIEQPEIRQLYEKLYRRHIASIDIIRGRAVQKDGVVFFDLAGCEMEGYNKFIPYYLFPDSVYTVSVSASSFRTKISVGSNPVGPGDPPAQPGVDLRAVRRRRTCRVGAISFEPGALKKARAVAAEIVAELKDFGGAAIL